MQHGWNHSGTIRIKDGDVYTGNQQQIENRKVCTGRVGKNGFPVEMRVSFLFLVSGWKKGRINDNGIIKMAQVGKPVPFFLDFYFAFSA